MERVPCVATEAALEQRTDCVRRVAWRWGGADKGRLTDEENNRNHRYRSNANHGESESLWFFLTTCVWLAHILPFEPGCGLVWLDVVDGHPPAHFFFEGCFSWELWEPISEPIHHASAICFKHATYIEFRCSSSWSNCNMHNRVTVGFCWKRSMDW